MYASILEGVTQPTGKPVEFRQLDFPCVVLAHRIYEGIRGPGQKGIKRAIEKGHMDHTEGKTGYGLDKRQICHILVITHAGIVHGNQGPTVLEILPEAV